MRHAGKTLLGEVLRIEHGWAFKGEYFHESGHHLVLTPGNFTARDGLRLRPDKDRYYGAEFPAKFLLSKGDLIVAMTDLTQNAPILGAPAFVPEDGRYLHNQRLGLVLVDDRVADRRFVYYLLQLDAVRSQIRATATGTTVRHTAPSRIVACEVGLPDLAEQQHLAGVLGAYDDLIALNERRMALLEESVHLLYREWFEQLRYPGYEWTSATDGVPEGWRRATFGDVVALVNDRVEPTAVDPSTPYVGLEHIPRRALALQEWGTAAEVESTKLRFVAGDILFGKIRPYFHKVVVAPLDGITSSDALVFRPKEGEHFGIATAVASSIRFVEHASSTGKIGTRMPRADWSTMAAYPLLLPSENVAREFTEYVRMRTDLIGRLVLTNRKLREARDSLLPRLMSGQLTA